MTSGKNRSRSQTVKAPGDGGNRPALIILDLISLFDFEGGAALFGQARAIAPRIARLQRRFRAAGKPVIYVNDNFMDWRQDFQELLALSARPGARGADIATTLRAESLEDPVVFDKKYYERHGSEVIEGRVCRGGRADAGHRGRVDLDRQAQAVALSLGRIVNFVRRSQYTA